MISRLPETKDVFFKADGLKSSVYFARARNYEPEEVSAGLSRLLKDMGGLAKHVRGKNVLLKPNLLRAKKKADLAATHPEVVRAAALACQQAGAKKIALSDVPGVQGLEKAAEKIGYTETAKTTGFEIRPFSEFVETRNPNPESPYKTFMVAKDALEAEAVVNLPKVKTHGMTQMTCAVKNLFGTVRPSERIAWHLRAGMRHDIFGDMLIDVFNTVGPVISIADGIVSMEGNGPGSGIAKHTFFLAGSENPHALDYTVARKAGGDVKEICTVKRALERKLVDPDEIEIRGEKINVPAFKFPPSVNTETFWGVPLPISKDFWKSCFTPRPKVDREKCVLCGICEKACPAKVITIENKRVKINHHKCIRCFCCQEHCPEGAIDVRARWMYKIREMLLP